MRRVESLDNVKLARLFDWALGVVFSLIKLLVWVLLVIIVVLAIN